MSRRLSGLYEKVKGVPLYKQLEKKTGVPWTPVKDGMGWEYHGPEGRIVRSYAEPILDWDGYSDTEFHVFLSEDGGWTKMLSLGIQEIR